MSTGAGPTSTPFIPEPQQMASAWLCLEDAPYDREFGKRAQEAVAVLKNRLPRHGAFRILWETRSEALSTHGRWIAEPIPGETEDKVVVDEEGLIGALYDLAGKSFSRSKPV